LNPETIETMKAVAAVTAAAGTVLASAYVILTRPLLRAMDSFSESIRAELKAEFATHRAEIKPEFIALRSEMKDMESRLNTRIDTHIVRK
jgi:hypothetical protein